MDFPKLPVALILLVLLGGFVFFIMDLNHISVNEIGVYYDSYSGQIWKQEKPGWYVTSWFVRVSYITTLPVRVTVPSEAKVIVSKYVRFKPEGLEDFIRRQGFSYFSNIENILMGYAFSGEQYPFLEVVQEPKPEVATLPPLYRK